MCLNIKDTYLTCCNSKQWKKEKQGKIWDWKQPGVQNILGLITWKLLSSYAFKKGKTML